jgi:hypothetical protein
MCELITSTSGSQDTSLPAILMYTAIGLILYVGIYIHADNRLHLVTESLARQDKRAHNLVRSHPEIEGTNIQDTFFKFTHNIIA